MTVLRKEWEALAAQHPGRLDLRFVLDKPPKNWQGRFERGANLTSGETGFITASMISKVFPKGQDRAR
ncbi:hypothetical protein, partial [Moraxella catarrhalis]|uniref:hypothetical protein n=1 Tax=Moraxella catarrhalis TaxID=480 RepID=UPI001D0DB70C